MFDELGLGCFASVCVRLFLFMSFKPQGFTILERIVSSSEFKEESCEICGEECFLLLPCFSLNSKDRIL